KLVYNSTAQRFECEADQNTGTSYLAAQGLTLASNFFRLNATLTGTSLEIIGTSSGRILYAADSLNSSGTLVVEGVTVLNGALTIRGATSGSTIQAASLLASSGTLIIEGGSWIHGTLSGNTLEGFNLTDCDADNQTLAWDATNKRFECGDDDTGAGGSTAPAQGLTQPASGFLALSTSFSGTALEIMGTASGRIVHAQDLLRSSGALVVEGRATFNHTVMMASGAILSGHLIPMYTNKFDLGSTDRRWRDLYLSGSSLHIGSSTLEGKIGYRDSGYEGLLFYGKGTGNPHMLLSSGGMLGIGTATPKAHLAVSGAVLLNPNGTIGSTAVDLGMALEVIGTTSGSVIHAQDLLTSSGSLTVEIGSASTATGVFIDQNGNGVALRIDSEATTRDIVSISASTITTGHAIQIDDADALTSGTGLLLNLLSNSSSASKRILANFLNDHASATSTLVMNIRQDAANGSLYIDQNGNGIGIDIDSEATSKPGMRVSMPSNNANPNPHILFGYQNFFDANLFRNDRNAMTSSGALTLDPYGFNRVYNFDGESTYTDNTTEARTTSGTTFSIFTVENPSNDYFYVGANDPFGIIYFDIAVAQDGISTWSAQFYNGSTWAELPFDDYTSVLRYDGVVKFNPPNNWAATTVSTDTETQYWIRFQTLDTNITTTANIYSISPTQDYRFRVGAQANDTEYALTVDAVRHVAMGTGANLRAALTIYTDNTFNEEAILINTDESNAEQNVFRIRSDVAGADDNAFRIRADGAVFSDNEYTSTGADYAEWFKAKQKLEPGEVVCIDVTQDNTVERCTREADANVMGIVSTNPAFVGNMISGADGIIPPGYELIGLIGQVPAKVLIGSYADGSLNIRPGDSLTPADKPGYARKALPGESTVGVALEGFSGAIGEEGMVNVLISRRNSSLTVDQVEQHVLDQIAAMQIEDEVQIMVADAVKAINVDDEIAEKVQSRFENLNFSAMVANILAASQGDTKSDDEPLSESGAGIWSIYETLKIQIEDLKTAVATLSGATVTRSPNYDTVAIEQTLITGGDARIGGDLHVDGALAIEDLLLTGLLSIDGSMDVGGSLRASMLELASGATVHGPLTVDGELIVQGTPVDLAALFATGATMELSNLIVREALVVLGDVDIQGHLRVFSGATIGGNLTVSGSLVLSARQTGRAVILEAATKVTIPFGTGWFMETPVITASADDFVQWRVSGASATGFTLEIKDPAERDVTFDWIAVGTRDARTIRGLPGGVEAGDQAIPVDAFGVPVSTSDVWNACIRREQPLDESGAPMSCSRYHDKTLWMHPDLQVQIDWDDERNPKLIVPEGYYIEMLIEEEGESEDSSASSGASESASSVSEDMGSGSTTANGSEPDVGANSSASDSSESSQSFESSEKTSRSSSSSSSSASSEISETTANSETSATSSAGTQQSSSTPAPEAGDVQQS
ncbi:hypothetical protein FJZ28_04405, partial [Candidatus Peregrinibacteria bacterium]|nr:hypothetical protein [Candidatus Peregrinibacteria bacterium]